MGPAHPPVGAKGEDTVRTKAAATARPPTFSVLINNYNYGRFVARAVASALDQTGADAEIIIVDDGSSDDSHAVLAGFRDRATIVLKRNGGQASAINAGVEASRGEYLCFLDADDWWAPGKLAAVGAAFRADPDAALVYHRVQPVQGDLPCLRPIPRSLCSGDLSRRMVRSAGWWPFPMTSAVAIRRSAWDRVGPIPAEFRISADAWLVGIYPFVGRVVALPEVLGSYRIHSNNWYRPVDDAAMLRRRMAHWRATVEATNRFLAAEASPRRLRLSDHFPYQVAAARLTGGDAPSRLRLALQGLRFAGEPNVLRRTRDTLRVLRELGPLGRPAELGEAAK